MNIYTLKPAATLKFNKCLIEKTITDEDGISIKPDVQLFYGKHKLLVEPHFTNPIDESKRRKLENLNLPTISINLYNFLKHRPRWKFDENDLKNYILKNPNARKWEYIRNKKVDQIMVRLIENYEKTKANIVKTINENNKIEKDIDLQREQISEICQKIDLLEKKKVKPKIYLSEIFSI